MFIYGVQIMGGGLKKAAGDRMRKILGKLTTNSVMGVLVGAGITAVIQSSSATTVMLVGFVNAGLMNLNQAIGVIMGTNIGTTVTNIIVSIGHIGRRDDFLRAFSAALVHDSFNLLSVIVIFPLWFFTHYLDKAAEFLSSIFSEASGFSFCSPLIMATDPPAALISEVLGETGWIILVFSLVLLFLSLRYMVLYMKAMIMSRAEVVFERTVFRTPWHGLLFGTLLTALVQSSSVTTSLMVPLAAAGMITLNMLFPYVLGANVGTTVTAMLAAMATGSPAAVSVAFSHFLFNISGILIFWKLRFIPISIARFIANISAKNRLFAIIYVLAMFFLFPLILIYLLE